MERNTPVRKPQTSTADLLTWSENPPADPPAPVASGSRSLKPASGINAVMFGAQPTEDEAESLNPRSQLYHFQHCIRLQPSISSALQTSSDGAAYGLPTRLGEKLGSRVCNRATATAKPLTDKNLCKHTLKLVRRGTNRASKSPRCPTTRRIAIAPNTAYTSTPSVIIERRFDDIVLFADDGNMHRLELFDEIQAVKWISALSVGILVHSGK